MEKQTAWNIATDELCEDCPHVRGCSQACQALRMRVRQILDGARLPESPIIREENI